MVEKAHREHKERLIETSPIVIKIGGSTLQEQNTAVEDISSLYRDGKPLIVVHGGGSDIDNALAIKEIYPKKRNGVRITDEKTLEIVIAVLTKINERLVEELSAAGVPAFGFTGIEVRLLRADVEDPSLGLVGKIREVNNLFLQEKMKEAVVPVVSPIAFSINQNSQLLNTNADMTAGAIAAAFPGSDLLLLTDVAGIVDQNEEIIAELNPSMYESMKNEGVIGDGMIPKIDAGFTALANGSKPKIIDGRRSHAIIQALRNKALGTKLRDD